MRTNYVLIDFENVQPESLDLLAYDHFRLLVFVGASQAKLPFEMAAAVQKLGSRAEYVKISGNGPNALDFHIAYYIGQLAAADSTAYFHIVSKDRGFDCPCPELATQESVVAEISAEQALVHANLELLRRMEAKMKAAIDRVWGTQFEVTSP